jgi:hypothetical protein
MASDVQGHVRKRSKLSPERQAKRRKCRQEATAGLFACFTLDGSDVNLHRRSVFSSERKEEVKGIRRRGACLRCRLLKRAVSLSSACMMPGFADSTQCSGEDPCKTCIAAAKAAINSKALMWMECIRPSFQAINIFDNCTYAYVDQPRHGLPN